MLPQSLHTKRSSGSPRLFAAAVWRQKSQTWSHSGISLSGLYNIYFIRKITFRIFLVNQVFIYILSRKPESKWRHIYFLQRAAMIHWCVAKLIYFFSWTEYQYWNNISLYYKTTKYATSANLWNHWLVFVTQAPLFLQLPDVSHEKLLYTTTLFYKPTFITTPITIIQLRELTLPYAQTLPDTRKTLQQLVTLFGPKTVPSLKHPSKERPPTRTPSV